MVVTSNSKENHREHPKTARTRKDADNRPTNSPEHTYGRGEGGLDSHRKKDGFSCVRCSLFLSLPSFDVQDTPRECGPFFGAAQD